MQPTERVTLRLPVQDLHEMDLYISLGHSTSRSEAIRAAIRDWLDKERSKAIERATKMEQVRALAGPALKADEATRK
jgi:Arc/MetJ-type ribon-helix-helix transcriptional regulator